MNGCAAATAVIEPNQVNWHYRPEAVFRVLR